MEVAVVRIDDTKIYVHELRDPAEQLNHAETFKTLIDYYRGRFPHSLIRQCVVKVEPVPVLADA